MNIASLFYPTEKIVGLEISKQYIKAILLKKSKEGVFMVGRSYVELEDGLIEDNKIRDKKKFIEILDKFKQENKDIFKSNNIVLSIFSNFIFTNFSSFPNLDYESLNKAVNLSLSTDMFFPDDVANIYYDWEEIPRKMPDRSDIFISFAKKENINGYIDVVSDAGFDLVAVEFMGRSMARVVYNFSENPGIIVDILIDGINFSVAFGGKILFSNFYKMPNIKSKEEFNKFVKNMLIKVVNFYNTDKESSGEVRDIVVIFPYKEKKEIIDYLKLETKLNFVDLAFDPGISKSITDIVDDFWISTFGSAIRGIIPREEDRDISLMNIGTEESFRKRKLMSYIYLWGDILSVVTIFFAILFSVSMFFMNVILTNITAKLSQLQVSVSISSEMKMMMKEAEKFNILVDRALEIKTRDFNLKKIVDDISELVPQNSIIPLIFELGFPNESVSLRVVASNSKTAFEFRDKIKGSNKFTDVKMPILGIDQREDVTFNISFKVINK
ncbi:MAG: pilus assembly protein PilM [Patescibacteria group bacterium]